MGHPDLPLEPSRPRRWERIPGLRSASPTHAPPGATPLLRFGKWYSVDTRRSSAPAHDQRPSFRSTRLRLLPTFLTTFFTAALERPDFFDSYPTSYPCRPATRARSCLRPRAVCFLAFFAMTFSRSQAKSNARHGDAVPDQRQPSRGMSNRALRLLNHPAGHAAARPAQ